MLLKLLIKILPGNISSLLLMLRCPTYQQSDLLTVNLLQVFFWLFGDLRYCIFFDVLKQLRLANMTDAEL